jgi:tetratricopeptide (TPR) repeat protein
MGRLDEAIQCFEEAVRLKPDYAGGWHNLGHALILMDKHAESIQPLDKAIALSYPEPKSHVIKVFALAQLGQLEEAIEVCDDGLNKWNDAELFRLKSGLLVMLKRHEECLATVNKAIENGFADDEMLIWKAATLIELKHFEEALTQFNEVLERSSGNLQARCGRAYCLCKTGKLGEGKQEIDQVVEGNPTDARSWYTRSHIYASLEEKVEMLASLKKAIQLEPELAQEAPGEEEFGPYRDLPEFEAIVKK